LLEIFEAIANLRENIRRTLLTASGVMAATIGVVLLASVAIGVRKDFTEQVQDLGVNVLIVLPGKFGSSMPNFNLGGASYLTTKEAKRIEKVPGVTSAACWTFVGGGATYKGNQAASFLVATTPEWFRIKKFNIKSGRLLTAADDFRDVAVIGSIAAEGLFDKEEALGKKINVNGRDFEVVGVTEDKKQENSIMSLGSFQNLIYIPYAALHKREPKSQTDRILVQIDNRIEPVNILKQIRQAFSETLDENQFDVLTEQDLLKVIYRFTDILQWLLIGLTAIALFVGGIGIMNVMLLSVGERTTEIGIRKATGANAASIFRQFIAESIGIALIGSIAGLLFSTGACWLIDRFTPIHPIITAKTVVGTLAASVVTGVVFGILPSMRAAKKDPVRAIQNLP
jgi:putative ABC transport system permease protein